MQHKNSPRRVKVDGHRGVYYREGSNGRRYEICFQGSDGRTRWQVVNGGLRDAIRERADVLSRLGRGEKVAPSRVRFGEVAETWLASKDIRPKTRRGYEDALRLHLLPRFERMQVAKITEDHVALLVSDMRRAGYAAWSIRGTLTPLSGIMAYAVRKGLASSNPVRGLTSDERPKLEHREQRILDTDGIGKLLDAATDKYRALLATAVFTGLRIGELLALRWADIDFDAGLVRVRAQLDEGNNRRALPKTASGWRDVVLMPELARVLKAYRLAAPPAFKGDESPVFASTAGTPMLRRNVMRRGLDAAADKAGLNPEGRPRLRMHDARHTFASLLISQGCDVVFVSGQLGHANPSITLRIYSHLFDHARHADRTRDALSAGFGSILERKVESKGRNGRENGEAASVVNLASVHASGTSGN